MLIDDNIYFDIPEADVIDLVPHGDVMLPERHSDVIHDGLTITSKHIY